MRILLCFLVLLASFSASSQILINEVCPANADLIHDTRFYNFSGWIELYNAGNTSVNVGGYYLSDKVELKTKWRIPSGTSIPSKGYLMIWCDERNSGLHTNFTMDADGEHLILSNTNITKVDEVEYPEQYTNVSYGRTSNGGNTWGYLINPTPGGANNSAVGTERLENPTISLKSGRYNGSQTLTMSHADQDVQIRYTTNGSEPRSTSSLYTGTLTVSKTSTIKAKAFKSGFIPSKAEVKTFFIKEHTFSLPVISISTKPEFLWNNTIGIYTNGTNGTTGNCQSEPFNWNQDWDRHAVIEFFDKNGLKQFDQPVDIRIGGACSRANPQKSIVVKARDKYGNNTIDEKLFSTKESNAYGGFILRNSGNDFWNTMFRDALMQTLVIDQMDIDYLAYEPKIFYLNGQYWGIQNLREKVDADYFESNYGVDKDDLDLGEAQFALEGSISGFTTYLNTLQSMNLDSEEAFTYIDNNIDVQAFINYVTAEIYYCNTDWPGNNAKYWRQKSTNGKWRWVLWDMDFGFGIYPDMSYATHPTLNFATEPNGPAWPNPPWSTRHLRLLLQNPEFKKRFIETLTTSLSTTFAPDRVIKFIDSFQNRIKTEMPYHTARWGQSLDNWNFEVQRLRDFASQRNAFMYGHIASFFGLGAQVRMDISTTPAGNAFMLNGITATDPLINGSYFKDLTYQVTAKPSAGYQFSHWQIRKRERTAIPLIERSSNWNYLDQGTDPGAGWSGLSFDDSSWLQGLAQLGYGDGDEQTVVSFGSDPNAKYITTYFRKTFDVADTTDFEPLSGQILFDDAVIVYLNGEEVFRNNLPEGEVTSSTLALSAAPENGYVPFTIPNYMLREGSNVLAVELHQVSTTSSDISFDLQLSTSIAGDEIEYTSSEVTVEDVADADIEMIAVFEPAAPIEGLIINEFCAVNSNVADEKGDREDWIEIYNAGAEPADLAGLFITDNLTSRKKYQIKPGKNNETVILPGDYKILWADEEVNEGPLHVNLKLSSEGESIGVYQMVGETLATLQEVTFDGYDTESTYSRIPNVTGSFALTAKATPLSENIFREHVPASAEELPDPGAVLFPNPASGFLFVTSAMEEIQFFNATGKNVISFIDVQPGVPVSIKELPPGIYLAKMWRAGKSTVTRFVKNN